MTRESVACIRNHILDSNNVLSLSVYFVLNYENILTQFLAVIIAFMLGISKKIKIPFVENCS